MKVTKKEFRNMVRGILREVQEDDYYTDVDDIEEAYDLTGRLAELLKRVSNKRPELTSASSTINRIRRELKDYLHWLESEIDDDNP